jgi:ankyrin repeat protein
MDEPADRILRAFFTSVDDGLSLLDTEPGLLHIRTGLGETPLHYLAVENHIEAIKALVEKKGADVNTLNDEGGSPISEAEGLGYVNLVKYLLSVGAKLQIPEQKESVLHAAVRSRSAEMVKVILNAGAAVNNVENLDETALHVAAMDDMVEIVRLLLEAGADPTAKRIFDETPLDVAIREGATRVRDELLKFQWL